MVSDRLEVECPVCDQKVPSDATRCPSCGAEFTFSGVEELQRVAQEINEARPPVEVPPAVVAPEVTRPVATAPTVAAVEDISAEVPATVGDDRPKDKLLGKLFKKKR